MAGTRTTRPAASAARSLPSTPVTTSPTGSATVGSSAGTVAGTQAGVTRRDRSPGCSVAAAGRPGVALLAADGGAVVLGRVPVVGATTPRSTGRPSTRRSLRSRSPSTATPGAAVNSIAASRQPSAHAGSRASSVARPPAGGTAPSVDRAPRPGGGGHRRGRGELRVTAEDVLRGQVAARPHVERDPRTCQLHRLDRSGGAIARHCGGARRAAGEEARSGGTRRLHGQGRAPETTTGVARWPVGVGVGQRGAYAVQVAAVQAQHHRRAGVVLARVGTVALADRERVEREDRERAGHRDHGDHRAGLTAPARLEQRRRPATSRPRPSSRRPAVLATGAARWPSEQADEQRQQRRPGQGEGAAEAPVAKARTPSRRPAISEGVERTERPLPGRDPPAPHQVVERLARHAYGDRHRRSARRPPPRAPPRRRTPDRPRTAPRRAATTAPAHHRRARPRHRARRPPGAPAAARPAAGRPRRPDRGRGAARRRPRRAAARSRRRARARGRRGSARPSAPSAAAPCGGPGGSARGRRR